MFKALGEEEMAIVIDAMQEVKHAAAETVITEGEPGAVLYVVEAGKLDCYKKLTKGVRNQPQNLLTFAPYIVRRRDLPEDIRAW
jgi:hypothetical protein